MKLVIIRSIKWKQVYLYKKKRFRNFTSLMFWNRLLLYVIWCYYVNTKHVVRTSLYADRWSRVMVVTVMGWCNRSVRSKRRLRCGVMTYLDAVAYRRAYKWRAAWSPWARWTSARTAGSSDRCDTPYARTHTYGPHAHNHRNTETRH